MIVEFLRPDDEHCRLEEILEPGQVWEIVSREVGYRIWREVAFLESSLPYCRYAIEARDIGTAPLKNDTPYKLTDWNPASQIWEDQITNQRVTERNDGLEIMAQRDGTGRWVAATGRLDEETLEKVRTDV